MISMRMMSKGKLGNVWWSYRRCGSWSCSSILTGHARSISWETYQKCTVLIPTSLVHIRWKKLCDGAPSTAGPAAVVCLRRKMLLNCLNWNGCCEREEDELRLRAKNRKPAREVDIVSEG